MAFDAFLKLGDGTKAPGESLDAAHKNEIDVLSFSLGTLDPHTPDRGGFPGGRGQRASILPLIVKKRIDRASPILFLMSVQGSHFDIAVLKVRRKGGAPLEFLTYTFKDVTVDAVASGGSVDTDANPIETVTFNFSGIQIKYISQNPDGTPGIPVEMAFELRR
jgi:type VI secretion system secreted protein Hcp